jgi:hypothetical protein
MPTCADIITQGLRLARVIASGENPKADEATDGMFALQSLFDEWVAGGVFGLMTDTYQTAAYTAKEQQIVITDGSPVITIPTTYDACGDTTGNPNGQRAPLDLACIQVRDRTAGTVATWLYDGAWKQIDALALTDEAPLASRGQMGMAAAVAVRFVESFGKGKVTPLMLDSAGKFFAAFGNRRIAARAPETAYF